MLTFYRYSEIPHLAKYLGSGDPFIGIDEAIADLVEHAVEPARLLEEDGSYSYFDLQPYR